MIHEATRRKDARTSPAGQHANVVEFDGTEEGIAELRSLGVNVVDRPDKGRWDILSFRIVIDDGNKAILHDGSEVKLEKDDRIPVRLTLEAGSWVLVIPPDHGHGIVVFPGDDLSPIHRIWAVAGMDPEES
jgi:hypothetical protein